MVEPYEDRIFLFLTASDKFPTPVHEATLYVPAASLSAYRTTTPWKEFGRILAIDDSDGIDEVVAQDMRISVRDGALCLENAPEGTPVSIYTPAGQMVGRCTVTGSTTTIDVPHKNVYIVKVGTKAIKVGL